MARSGAQPLARPTADARSVSELVDAAREGRLRVPPFQRRFRWARGDVERLFDSIWEGYPIGSLLLWERAAPAARLEFGPVSVEAPPMSDALYVVDGQQRLTSLVGVLAAPKDVRGDFDLYFDLGQEAFRYAGSRNPPATWVPMRLALDTNGLLSWLLEFKEQGGSDEHVDAVTTLGERIREYRIPVSTVRNADEETLRIIFDRMNNFGRRLTKAEVFQALHAASGDRDPHDLTDLGDEVAGLGFGSLRDDTLLRSVLAIRGGDVFRDFRREFEDGDDPADTYRKAADALRRTVLFMQGDAGIPHVRALPYAFVIPVLVRFFSFHPEPSARTRVLLRRWIWRAAVTGAGSGSGSTQLLRRMVQNVGESEDLSVQRLLLALGPFPAVPLDLKATQLNRAAARVNIALLSTLDPKDLRDGEPIDVSQLLDTDDPAGLLRIPGADGRVASLASVFLHPSLDDDEIADVLAGAPDDALKSQALSKAAAVRALTSSSDALLTDRLATLQVVLSQELLALAEPEASDRPPIASLIVSDEP